MSEQNLGDRIELRGLSAVGYHGVFEHERREGQTFIVDLDLSVDLEPAATSGELFRTVHYGELAEQVVAQITSDPVDLIETLALRIVNVCLGHEPVRWARVTVHKPQAPIEVAFTDVAVTMERSKQ